MCKIKRKGVAKVGQAQSDHLRSNLGQEQTN